MGLYEMMTNISGNNIEKVILESINRVNNILKDLTKDLTCKIYNSYVFRELRDRHIPVRLVNTKDLGFSYEHYFVLVPNDNKYYIVDMTYGQFNINSELTKNGYQEIDNDSFNSYLRVVTRENSNGIMLDDVFYSVVDSKKSSLQK